MEILTIQILTLKYWVGVQLGQSYLMGEGVSLALVHHPSSDGVTIKIFYGVDVYYINQPFTPSLPIGLVQLNLTLLLDQSRVT